jgi:6-phosphogluconolactonase (cycloisomerase 2 family)
MVFDPSEEYLYSADMWADKIWTHKKASDGTLTLVGSVDAPSAGDHPRWVEMHPSGHYLYVLMEAGNRLGVYVIDEKTHLPVFTQNIYPLVPPGTPDASRALDVDSYSNAKQVSEISRRCTGLTSYFVLRVGNTSSQRPDPTHPA